MLYFFSICKIISTNVVYYVFVYYSYNEFIINILKQLAELNITFAKIFQWSFINKKQKNKYITDEINDFVYNYTNNTPYTNLDIDYSKILQIYIESKNLNDRFELTDIKPINSGTISLVFKGKLNDKPVVIKLLRNNVETELIKGLNLLTYFGYLISIIPYYNVLMFDKIIDKNKKNFYEQINFTNEVSNIQLYYNKLRRNKFCISPNVYPHYTEKIKDIIIMDYIDGKKLDELSDDEKQNFISVFIKFLKNTIFYKNVLHCDLHPGNVLFITDNIGDNIVYKIGVIDMGMIVNLSVIDCNFCYYFINCIFNEKFNDLIEYIFSENVNNVIFDKINSEKILELKNFLILQHNEHNLFKINEIENVTNDTYVFLNLFKKYDFEFSENIFKMILGLLPIFSIIVGLGNNSKNNLLVKEEFAKMENNNSFDDL